MNSDPKVIRGQTVLMSLTTKVLSKSNFKKKIVGSSRVKFPVGNSPLYFVTFKI